MMKENENKDEKKWYLPGTDEEVSLEDITEILDCGGSGTTMRCAIPFAMSCESHGRLITLDGDASLRKRKIDDRMLEIFEDWGYLFVSNNGCVPLTMLPKKRLEFEGELGEQIKANILANLKLVNDAVVLRGPSSEEE